MASLVKHINKINFFTTTHYKNVTL